MQAAVKGEEYGYSWAQGRAIEDPGSQLPTGLRASRSTGRKGWN